MTTLPIYYALWYYTFNNEKSANAISASKDDLWELHNNSILNPDCYYHKYKKSILKIEVLPIQVYIYKNNQFISSLNFKEEEEDRFAFYSSYNVYFLEANNNNNNNNNNLEEILIYMSKEDHKIWRIKYEENPNAENDENRIPISLNPVNLNEYYEEGIMNA